MYLEIEKRRPQTTHTSRPSPKTKMANKYSYKTAELQSTVVICKDGRALEVRRGPLTGAAIPDRCTWPSKEAWLAWLPEGAAVDGLAAAGGGGAAAGGGGAAVGVPDNLRLAAVAADQALRLKREEWKVAADAAKEQRAGIREQIAALRAQLEARKQELWDVGHEARELEAAQRELREEADKARNRVTYWKAAQGRNPADIRADAELLNAQWRNLRKRDLQRYSTFEIRNALLLKVGEPLDSDRFLAWDRDSLRGDLSWAHRPARAGV